MKKIGIVLVSLIVIALIGIIIITHFFTYHGVSNKQDILRVAEIAVEKHDPLECTKVYNAGYFYEGFGLYSKILMEDLCLELYSYNSSDSRGCGYINSPESRGNRCYAEVAAKTVNVENCNQITDERTKNECIYAVVSVAGNTSYCGQISDAESKKHCLRIEKGQYLVGDPNIFFK